MTPAGRQREPKQVAHGAYDAKVIIKSLLGAAAHPLETAGHHAGVAADFLASAKLPRMLAQVEQASGLPVGRVSRTAASLASVPLQMLAQWRPQPGFPAANASYDILSTIADQLDRKTLMSFARANKNFAQIGAAAVRDLTFRGPDDLRAGLETLGKQGMARFAERGLHSLSLMNEQYRRDDIAAIPAWMRQSVRTLHLEAPLADDAWPCLSEFTNLREVTIAQTDGLEVADLARLPGNLHKINLSMPMTPQALEELERFQDLKEIGVTVATGARLGEVFDQLAGAAAGGANAKSPLGGVSVTSLKVRHSSSDEDNLTPGNLKPDNLNRLMKLPLESLDMPLKGAELNTVLTHPTLRELRCAASGLDTAEAKHIAANQRLEKVELPYNDKIGDAGIQALLSNKRIRSLNIGRCGGSDRLILRLHKTRPAHLNELQLST